MILLLWCFMLVLLIALFAIREGYLNYGGNTRINLPTRVGDQVNYNFSSFSANGTVDGPVKWRPAIPPPRNNHYRNWVWDVYYTDSKGVLHASGHWNYYNTFDYDYDYYGPSGIANYNRYFY